MKYLIEQIPSFNGQQKRVYRFRESGELQLFLKNYRMNIDKCLKSMAMDEECKMGCSERKIYEFGKDCEA